VVQVPLDSPVLVAILVSVVSKVFQDQKVFWEILDHLVLKVFLVQLVQLVPLVIQDQQAHRGHRVLQDHRVHKD
jgi:uncharacterized membrane protein